MEAEDNETDGESRDVARPRMLLNMKAVRDYVKSRDKELSCSMEFIRTLNAIMAQRIDKACRRNRSLSRRTLKKDELFM
jgi:hypothetical protein